MINTKPRTVVDKILINQVGTKININLNTKNIFEPGAYYSYLGPSIENSMDQYDESHEGQQPPCNRLLRDSNDRSTFSGKDFDTEERLPHFLKHRGSNFGKQGDTRFTASQLMYVRVTKKRGQKEYSQAKAEHPHSDT